jgi:hypothetical protein
MFERAKPVDALDRAVTVIGPLEIKEAIIAVILPYLSN